MLKLSGAGHAGRAGAVSWGAGAQGALGEGHKEQGMGATALPVPCGPLTHQHGLPCSAGSCKEGHTASRSAGPLGIVPPLDIPSVTKVAPRCKPRTGPQVTEIQPSLPLFPVCLGKGDRHSPYLWKSKRLADSDPSTTATY